MKRWAMALAALASGCGSPPQEPVSGGEDRAEEARPAGPRGDIAFHLYKNPEDERPHVSIYTPHFEQAGQGLLRLEDFRVVLRGEEMGDTELQGAQAEYRQEDAVIMPGRVTLRSEAFQGAVEGLRWIEATGEAVSEGRVDLRSETNHVRAEGMRLRPGAGTIRLRDARGTIDLGGKLQK